MAMRDRLKVNKSLSKLSCTVMPASTALRQAKPFFDAAWADTACRNAVEAGEILISVQFHLGHLVIMVLQLVHIDVAVKLSSVFPPPDFHT